MRVLITGSVGMIGRKQVEVVRAAGHTVRTFDRFPQKGPDTGEHHVGDLRDMLTMRRMVQGMDAVNSLAGLLAATVQFWVGGPVHISKVNMPARVVA